MASAKKATKEPKVLTGTYGVVMYSDGGCKPSRGFGGWGAHGYLYNTEVSNKGSGCKGGFPTVEGYASTKTTELTMIKYFDGIGSLSSESTNQEAELVAMIKSITKVISLKNEYDIQKACFYTDSKYVLDGLMDWTVGWMQNNWRKNDGSEIKNVGYWKRLVEVANQLRAIIPDVKWGWIKGHNGDVGNTRADKMASRGVVMSIKGNNEILHADGWKDSDAQGYWSKNVFYNRLLSHSRWYFNTNNDQHIAPSGNVIYYCGDHGSEDDWFGKRQADSCFSVLHLKMPIEVMEVVRAEQNRIAPSSTTQQIIMGRLDNILQSDNYAEIEEYGARFMHYNPRHGCNLYLPGEAKEVDSEGNEVPSSVSVIPLTKEINPPRLAWVAVEQLQFLDSILNDYLSTEPLTKLTITDITDILYEVDRTKKTPTCKLRSHITSALKTIDIDVNYDVGALQGKAMVKLIVGLDTIKRNDLSALASRFPKVSVISWRESDCAFRYATIVEVGDDIGLFCGAYSNIRVLI